ncbi:MAG: DUF348 domain-containing protein [Actinobacteria bacterium]|nr:DUF348 domain-containing protein [Actinomycetota bacterium]
MPSTGPAEDSRPSDPPDLRPRLRPRRWRRRLSALGVFGAVAAGAGAWWWEAQNEVRVLVDGREIAVRTRASTVAGALQDRGITLEAHDRVAPPLEALVRDGTQIAVSRARSVTLDVNGARRTVWTTSDEVSEVLSEVGVDGDVIEAPESLAAGGSTVVVQTGNQVTVTADGGQRAFRTGADTVGALLDDVGIGLDGDDEVAPGREASVSDGLAIEVTRVETDVTVEEHSLPFSTERRDDSSILRGQVKTVRDGTPGLERVEYELTRRNGEVVEKEVISRTVIREPVDRVLAVGTKVTDTTSGKASWFSGAAGTCAHRTLPMGTNVSVTNVATGQSVVCRVADRGPYVDGRVIDLSHDAFSQIANTGAGVVSVRISW